MTVMARPENPAPASHRAAKATEHEQGAVARWPGKDPVRTVAIALIVASVVWRADIASRGFLTEHDFAVVSRAAQEDLTYSYLGKVIGDHLTPGGMTITWVVQKTIGLAYWPYLLLLMAGHAALGICLFRLLRQLHGRGFGTLIPLSLLLFNPLTLEVTSWWVVGMTLLPMQLAMVLAIGAQVKYARTRQLRHLFTLAAAMIFGLLFFEKSLLIAPLVFLTTACLLVDGNAFRSVVITIRRYWPSWAVLTVISLAYISLYFSGESSAGASPSAAQVANFLRQLVGSTIVPGLAGGPWQWLDGGDGTPVAWPDDVRRWLAWAGFATLVVTTILLRRVAIRAWVLLALYTGLVAAPVAIGRLSGDGFGPVLGYIPRYVADVMLVAALCIGVALLGIHNGRDSAPTFPSSLRAKINEPGIGGAAAIVLSGLVVVMTLGVALTGARFSANWADREGRDYIANVQADLAKAEPGTVFFDRPVPERLLWSLSYPYNLQSNFLRPLRNPPVFVTEAEQVSIIDDAGHIHRAVVAGPNTLPGPEVGCGYKLSERQTVRMQLTGPMFAWDWAVRVGYLSGGDATATVRLGNGTREFKVRRGLHEVYLQIEGGGDAVEMTINDPSVTVCVDIVTVGTTAPAPTG